MTVEEFETMLKKELKSLGIELLDLYNRRGYLCVEWQLPPYDKFTSAFKVNERMLGSSLEETGYIMIKDIYLALSFQDVVRGQIKDIR